MSTPPAPKKQRRSQNGQNESVVCEEDDADSPFNLYFVQVPDTQKKEAENLEIMFKAAKKCGLVPEWIDEQALDRLQTSDDFFVFPCFSGKIFRKIQARKLRLFGPPILSECLDERKQLPDSRLPIFSSVFEGVKVSFTNIGSEKRAELLEKVAWMGGVVSHGLHGETTHLVCGSAGMSEKYKIATRNSIKLMRTDWIDDLWKTSSTAMGKFSALDRDVVDSYSLPVFHGLHVVLSSIDGTDRMTLSQLIADNGGESQGVMRKAQCTHLVTENTTSQKYKKALEWGSVKIVTTRWIRKCIDLGHIIDEAKYHPRLMSMEHIRSSTPKKDANMTSTGPDISSIHGAGGRLSFNNSCSVLTPTVSSQLPNNRFAFNASTSSSVVNSTVVQDSRRRSDQNPSPIVRNAAAPFVRYSTVTSTQNTTVHDPIDELRTHMEGLEDLFENCLFLMFGVESKHIDKWRRFLDSTGATRVSKIDSATHVVVLDPSLQEKTTIRKFVMKEDIAIVTVEWVAECVRKRTIVATDEFLWTEVQLEDTFSQPTPVPLRDIPPRPNQMSSSMATPKEKIFAALTFHINDSLFKKAELERDIRANGGIIQEDPDRAQYVVFGATTAPICDLIRFETVITDLYINTCINSQVLLNLPEHPLFVPLPRPPTIVFDKRRIAVQSSASLLGDYVKSIVRSNGGELIESVDARSILVVMEDGKVPLHLRSRAVGLSWVIASLARNRVQPLEDHAWREGRPTLGNYQRDDDVWMRCIQDNEPTQEMETEDLRVDRKEEHGRSENRKTGSCPLENPYFPDLRQPFKMNLNLEGANEVINEMPSYVQQYQSQESFTTSMIGGILKQAVRNTGRRKEDVEPIVRPPSVVVAENRRTVSSTPVLQRKNNRFPEVSDSILDQNMEQVEALNREYAQRRHVLISSTEKDVDELRKCIEALGGVVDKDLNSDSSILITDRLKRSPNNLGMIAAGGWCLTADYLYDSLNAGKWLPEEPYEWNLETVRRLGLEHDAHVKALAAVVKPWRVHVANMPITHSVSTELRRNGAFSDWRCAVHVNDSRMLQVCSIIEFGGAIVFQISEYIEVTSHRPTCAMACRAFPWNVQSAAMLKRDNIPLYNMEIVYEYLVHKDSLDLRTLYHPSYPQ